MSLHSIARLTLAATLALAVLPARAGGEPGLPPGYGRHVPPPEVRYRDPRPAPRRVHASRFVAAPVLIEAYLPRFTEHPMYNEPPSRFPRR